MDDHQNYREKRMPLTNRVDPFGTIMATSARGGLMGNRGYLHDANHNLIRPWTRKSWIICLLEFKGRHREVMSPGRYTELFFLDEATALVAGHRPCARCQKYRLEEFRGLLRQVNADSSGDVSTATLDSCLHRERLASTGKSNLWSARIGDLPDGTFVLSGDIGQQPCIWHSGVLRPWSFNGYGPVMDSPSSQQDSQER